MSLLLLLRGLLGPQAAARRFSGKRTSTVVTVARTCIVSSPVRSSVIA